MKTHFDKLMNEITKFEEKAGFDKTSKKQLIKWLGEEIKNYKNAKTTIIKENILFDGKEVLYYLWCGLYILHYNIVFKLRFLF